MARRKRSKKPRGSRGFIRQLTASGASTQYHDLNVPIPRVASGQQRLTKQQTLKSIVDRLGDIGYRRVALSHTVYGRPTDRDDAELAVAPPRSSVVDGGKKAKRRRRSDDVSGDDQKDDVSDTPSWNGGGNDGMKILRRLNVIVEELADVGLFSGELGSSSPQGDGGGSSRDKKEAVARLAASRILNGYDVVALSARSEAAFSAACASARGADVLMLDYSQRGRLPFRLRSSDVRAATQLGLAFELCYGPALADQSKRKFFVQAAREFATASVGVLRPRPTLILSSGPRVASGGSSSTSTVAGDLGAMVLRTPGDLSNVVRVVLGLSDEIAFGAMGRSAALVVERGQKRRTGEGTYIQVLGSRRDETGGSFSIRASSVAIGAPGQSGELFAHLLPSPREVTKDGGEVKVGGDKGEGDGFLEL